MSIDCEVTLLSSANSDKTTYIAKTGARTIGSIIVFLLKIIGTLLLIGVTTLVIFACIFTVYVKTNLTQDLDVSMKEFQMSLSSEIFYKDANSGTYKELVTLQSKEYRKWVDYDAIPKFAEHAIIAIEDKRFYDHHGVDWYRTFGAFGNMFLSMKDNFGGSTITQQLIKNLTNESEVTVQRKLLEIFRALQFEKEYKKTQIIEWYLNVVNFGGSTYGIGAAANYYFGKDTSALTLAECATIVGITNNPSVYNPYIDSVANKKRQEDILTEMYNQGYITKQQMDEAKAQKLVFQKGKDNSSAKVTYTYFEDAVIEDVIADLKQQKGISTQVAENLLFTQGYQIRCTVDPTIQKKVDSIYQDLDSIPKVGGSSQQIQSAIVLADPFTGDILAMEGGVGQKTGNRLLNRATQSQRPPGSSIKPLAIYSPAIEYGLITPETRFEDAEDVKLSGTDWMPNNDDFSYHGVLTVREALISSINTVSAQILDKLTPATSYDFMVNKLGFTLSPYDQDYAPLALGQLTNGATVREMAQGYTMFANNGVETHLVTYSQVLASDGKTVILDNKKVTSVAISPVTAYWVTSMLQDAAEYGTGYEANLGDIMPMAGKTGTTTSMKDRWFCGFTPYYVAVVWTGFDTPATMQVSGNPSAQTWHNVMSLVSTGQEYKEFPKPADTYLSPVPGVDLEVSYTIKCVTADGKVLQTVADRVGVPGKKVTETAPVIPGYTISGEASKTMTLSKDKTKNIMTFLYQPVAPSPSPSPSPSGSASPSASGSPSPSSSGKPTASASPSASAKPSASHSPSPSTTKN